MDTQYCLQCELHKDKIDQDGCKYCYCFFNPDKGRWVAEIETCPKLGNHSGSSETSNDLEEAAKKYAHCPFTDDDGNFHEDAFDANAYHDFIAGAKWQKKQDNYDTISGKAFNTRRSRLWRRRWKEKFVRAEILAFLK